MTDMYRYQGHFHPDTGKLSAGQFSARGNYGELICDVATGAVVKYLPDTDACPEDNYTDIKALNVKEYEARYQSKVIDQGFYDIVDFNLEVLP